MLVVRGILRRIENEMILPARCRNETAPKKTAQKQKQKQTKKLLFQRRNRTHSYTRVLIVQQVQTEHPELSLLCTCGVPAAVQCADQDMRLCVCSYIPESLVGWHSRRALLARGHPCWCCCCCRDRLWIPIRPSPCLVQSRVKKRLRQV